MKGSWTYDLIAQDFDSIMNRNDLERRLQVVFEQLLAKVDLVESWLLRRLDRLGGRLGRVFVNQCLAGQKAE